MLKPVISVFDDAWKKDFSSNYTLSLLISKNSVGACIADKIKKKYLALEWYVFPDSGSFSHLKSGIRDLFKQNEIFGFPYQGFYAGIMHYHSAIVPEELFDEKNVHEFLTFHYVPEPSERIRVDELPLLKSKNIYPIDGELIVLLQECFENIVIHHSTTSLVEILLRENKLYNDTRIFVNIHRSTAQVIVFEKGKLLLYNFFDFQTPEDFIFYILFICRELAIHPEQVNFYFLGEIEKQSALYNITYKYIRNVYFGRRPNSYNYSYKFAFFPSHHYYNLFSLGQMES